MNISYHTFFSLFPTSPIDPLPQPPNAQVDGRNKSVIRNSVQDLYITTKNEYNMV